jgi:hypothetical protein
MRLLVFCLWAQYQSISIHYNGNASILVFRLIQSNNGTNSRLSPKRVGPPVGEPIFDMGVWPSPVILV